MLKILRAGVPGFEEIDADVPGWRLPDDTVWIELIEPTRAEELAVERQVGVSIPTREEMAEIEASSRLYQEGGATFMTATVLYASDAEVPMLGPITFVLVGERLVTVRYMEPRSFRLFSEQAEKQPALCPTGPHTFLNLLDAVVDRTADILEKTAADLEACSRTVFARRREGGFEPVLRDLGRAQMVNAKARDSLVSLSRLISFAALAPQIEKDAEARGHLKSLARDVASLTDYGSYLAGNVGFSLDAALGLINIEQNAIIKIFSVAAVAFLPPTLIASIYGMNFEHMPELDWRLGYPMALGLMVLSAVVPLWWFKQRGWL